MVYQRAPIRSSRMIYSVDYNGDAAVDDDDESKCTDHNPLIHPPPRRRPLTFRPQLSTSSPVLKVGFILLICLTLLWSGYDTNFLRKLRLSKQSSIDVLDPSYIDTVKTADEMMMVITSSTDRHVDDVTMNIEDTNENLSFHQNVTAGIDNPLPVSNVSISSLANNQNVSSPPFTTENDPCYRMKGEADIRLCYASQDVKKFSDPQCQSIQTWSNVQQCLMRRYHYPNLNNNRNNQINEVHVLGERNSGTKFVTQFLQQCYPKSSRIKVHRDFIRSKHFFQPIYNQMDYSQRLIVVVVRDPVEWMAAMRQFPYHSPSHLAGFQNGQPIPLPWPEFVNKTWTTDPSRADNKVLAEHRKKTLCSQGFRFDEVKPCIIREEMVSRPPWNIPPKRVRGYYPLYEQRRGKPYDHLLQMRSDKIVNWILQIPLLMKIGGFIVVRYEDILERGNAFFLEQVNALLNNKTIDSREQPLPRHCSVIHPQPNRIGKRYIPPDFKDWINSNLDVETERLIGYR